MLKDNESICVNCDKKIDDDIETKWDLYADPYCRKCFSELNLVSDVRVIETKENR